MTKCRCSDYHEERDQVLPVISEPLRSILLLVVSELLKPILLLVVSELLKANVLLVDSELLTLLIFFINKIYVLQCAIVRTSDLPSSAIRGFYFYFFSLFLLSLSILLINKHQKHFFLALLCFLKQKTKKIFS